MGARQHQRGFSRLQPDGGIAAEPVEQQDGVVGNRHGLGGIQAGLQLGPQAIAADMLAQFQKFNIHRMRRVHQAKAGFALEDIAGNELETKFLHDSSLFHLTYHDRKLQFTRWKEKNQELCRVSMFLQALCSFLRKPLF